jgi:hypothetical protein
MEELEIDTGSRKPAECSFYTETVESQMRVKIFLL